MAAARLDGVLDAAVRGTLTPSQLVGVAGRAQAAITTAIERGLLDALPIADLTTLGMTAFNFVLLALAPVATVQGATRAAERRPDAKALQRARVRYVRPLTRSQLVCTP